ncbi:unnamed protein product [Camellia sinensis]
MVGRGKDSSNPCSSKFYYQLNRWRLRGKHGSPEALWRFFKAIRCVDVHKTERGSCCERHMVLSSFRRQD